MSDRELLDRRHFMRLAGVSAMAGAAACVKQPVETIVPWVDAPERAVPGKPLFYATAVERGGYGTGVLVESHMGRPTRAEGNPAHPASLGALDPLSQGAIWDLYDPRRSTTVLDRGLPSSWERFFADMQPLLAQLRAEGGAGLAILSEPTSSATFAAEMRRLLAALPSARWVAWSPLAREAAEAGARLAFGERAEVSYRLDAADVVLALDADFMTDLPGSLRYSRDFMAARRLGGVGRQEQNRLYVVESTPSVTGSVADHRLRMRAADVLPWAQALAARLGVKGDPVPALPGTAALDAIARDLRRVRERGLCIVGDRQPPELHALAHLINAELGSLGPAAVATAPVLEAPGGGVPGLVELTDDIDSGRVRVLVVLGANPVYAAPADLRFAERLSSVPLRIHAGSHADETARLCHWHLPLSHAFESWADVRGFDGTVTLQQPLIAPLYGTRSALELVSELFGRGITAHDLLREHWRGQRDVGDFEAFWRRTLHDGVMEGSALAARTPELHQEAVVAALASRRERDADDSLEITFHPDPSVWDGRFVANGWLQELPKPITKLTWDNAALISPRTAERLRVDSESVVWLELAGRRVQAPVYVLPGQADGSVAVTLGYGRHWFPQAGGFDAYALRSRSALGSALGLVVQPTAERWPLASTQEHHELSGRDIVRARTFAQITAAGQAKTEPAAGRRLSLYAEWPKVGPQWAMVIDQSVCIGCNACVIGCVAENNISVVGKREVARGREMHWIRVDQYRDGDPENPTIYNQPMTCQHCEEAPCEVVCPVNATVHGPDGLNEMVYNRCVGTRYCSNNCPWKVRRFNFLLYSDWGEGPERAMRNPDVTVRSRGVMEKCTYCVQRISAARIDAKKEGRAIADGEVKTACQQACPTSAIVFGNMADPASAVARYRDSPLSYAVLGELGTSPRTTYLERISNPNPELG